MLNPNSYLPSPCPSDPRFALAVRPRARGRLSLSKGASLGSLEVFDFCYRCFPQSGFGKSVDSRVLNILDVCLKKNRKTINLEPKNRGIRPTVARNCLVRMALHAALPIAGLLSWSLFHSLSLSSSLSNESPLLPHKRTIDKPR